jgi:hypothetical protein
MGFHIGEKPGGIPLKCLRREHGVDAEAQPPAL